MTILGRATPEGTRRFSERHCKNCASGYFREAGELIVSSIGVGTYLGKSDERTNALVKEAVVESVHRGVNLIDSSINYRSQQGERSVGRAIQHLVESGETSRDELIICTKGGVVPSQRHGARWFYKQYVEPGKFDVTMADLVAKRYCLHPEYLRDQLDRSLTNLGLQTIDIYYIHNPEIQLFKVSSETLYNRLRAVFEVMEEAIRAGKIAAYGLATWHGLRVPLTSRQHLDLANVKSIAQEVATNGQDRLQFVQLPLNLAMQEALVNSTQAVEGKPIPALEAIHRLDMNPIISRSIHRAKVIGKLPKQVVSFFGEALQTDCQRALQYTRSAPYVRTALVGMKAPEHVEENLALSTVKPLNTDSFQKITHAGIELGKFRAIRRTLNRILGK